MPEKGVNRREREVLFDHKEKENAECKGYLVKHREMEKTELVIFLLTA